MTTIAEINYALMAGASYISTRAEINRFPVPNGWSQRAHPMCSWPNRFSNGSRHS